MNSKSTSSSATLDLLHEAVAGIPVMNSQHLEFAELPGGNTNQNFVIKAARSKYVLRIAAPHSSARLGISRSNEYAALRAAAEAGIAPKVLWWDEKQGILLSEFVPGRHWSVNDIRANGNCSRLTTMLTALHSLKANLLQFDPFELGCQFESQCQCWPLAPQLRQQWKERVSTVLSGAENQRVPCFCHNDINRGNFIDDGEGLWLIDWECAGLGDPFYDLAIISHNNNLSATEELTLLEAYCGQVRSSDIEHLARMKVAHDFYHVFWYGSQLTTIDGSSPFHKGCEFHASRLVNELQAFDEPGQFEGG